MFRYCRSKISIHNCCPYTQLFVKNFHATLANKIQSQDKQLVIIFNVRAIVQNLLFGSSAAKLQSEKNITHVITIIIHNLIRVFLAIILNTIKYYLPSMMKLGY